MALDKTEREAAAKLISEKYGDLYRAAVAFDAAGGGKQQILSALHRLAEIFITRHCAHDPERMRRMSANWLNIGQVVLNDAVAVAAGADECNCAVCQAYRRIERPQ